MDLNNKPTIDDYHIQLQGYRIKPAVFSVDAREKNDVSLLVQALLYSIDPGIESE
nr:hypothetical protein [Methylomarinum sp. Ch1-1]MDP4521122.1 hypothetical protein [Methylomarinum sp. Ch1-1]